MVEKANIFYGGINRDLEKQKAKEKKQSQRLVQKTKKKKAIRVDPVHGYDEMERTPTLVPARRTMDSWIVRNARTTDGDDLVCNIPSAVVIESAVAVFNDNVGVCDVPCCVDYSLIPIDAVSLSGCALNNLPTSSHSTSTRDGPLV